ncbi:MAG: type II secretion system F family protein [Butyrivibrio sp.]|uniref:type II secretion system F family protein n=1 Tax=Butyrivibrio sp. TaxID=28121 RepID=UPI0025C62D17|nr:pilus assembly protein TadB [Butyrivibrio sp.]MBQ6589359.1 type II secretion system F family protein [Butyrivibrio sp.]
MFGRLFFDSWLAVLMISPIAIPWTLLQRKNESIRKCRQIGIQFKDAIFSVLTSLKAGFSIENSFLEARRDMDLLYGKNSDISFYLSRISKGLKNSVPLEKLIFGMGKETGNSDIQDFALVFAVAKRSGGNMTEIIDRTISVISGKLEVEKEIDVLISAKRLEAKIMNMVPFFIIFYISITSPGFFDALYHNFFGIILMTVCMVIYCISYVLSEKIVNIRI